MPINLIKSSFAGGEVSPSLYPRVDLAKYTTWLKKARNLIIHPTGGASNRAGLHMVAQGKDDGKKLRIRKFIFSTTQKYQLEFGDYYVRFFIPGASGGAIEKSAGSAWVTGTAYAVNDIVEESGSIYRCVIAHTAAAAFATDLAAFLWEVDIPAWVTTTDYVIGNYVYESSKIYYCIGAHTSGVFANDSAYWVEQSIYEVPTPYAEADLPYLKFTQSADVLFITNPDNKPKQLNRLSNALWTLTDYDFVGGPFMLPNTDSSIIMGVSAVTGPGVVLTAGCSIWKTGKAYKVGDYCEHGGVNYYCLIANTSTVFANDLAALKWVLRDPIIFHSTHIGSLWQLEHYIEGQAVNKAVAGTSTSIKCGGTWRVISHGTWTGKFSIEKSTDNGTAWTNLRTFTGTGDFNANTYGTEDMANNAEPFLLRINIDNGTPNVDLTTDPFYQKGIIKITGYSTPLVVTGEIKRTMGLTTSTIDWTEGSWSDYRGWPAVVEFSPQDRLIFANTYTEPQTTWATKTGNYYDFSRSSPLVDSDGITVNLPSREVNGINNLVPLTALMALTSSSEWSIGAPGSPFTPTSVEQRIHGYEGSADTDAVVIGNRAIFVQAQGALIRDLGYELNSDSFTGADLTVLANHLFQGYSIVSLDYQKFPDRIAWFVRSDGKLLSMTYMREQEVLAWCWHDTNNGTDLFESVSVVPATGYDEVWVSVKRGTKRYIERMDNRLASTDPVDQFFVDCGVTYDGGPVTDITSGIDHLEGKTVAVLADGNVLSQKVVTGGAISLGGSYSVVHIGLPYTSDLETLNVEIGLPDGSAQGRKMKIGMVTLKVLNSRGGWIGPDFSTLYELRGNLRALYGTALALYSGDIQETLAGGYEDGGRVCIRQLDPLPLTISAIIPSVTPGGKSGV